MAEPAWTVSDKRMGRTSSGLFLPKTASVGERNNVLASQLNKDKVSGMRRTGANLQMALPKQRVPMGSLMDKGIPYDTTDPKQLAEARSLSRLYYRLHDLVPLLIDMYSQFPLNGLEFQCFAGETPVITEDGVFPISELSGGAHRILTTGGKWVEAPFKSFGAQSLMRIVVQRNGRQREFFVTSGHRWFAEQHHQKRLGRNSGKNSPLTWEKVDSIREMAEAGTRQKDIAEKFDVTQVMVSKIVNHKSWTDQQRAADRIHTEPGWQKIEVTTENLKPGMRLVSSYGRNIINSTNPSPFGVARGMTFGDGARKTSGGGCHVDLYGDKDANLLSYFAGCTTYQYYRADCNVQAVRVSDLPRYFKERPSLKESVSYLYGWLSGYFAADGTVSKKGECFLDSARRGDIDHAQAICQILGIHTSDVYEVSHSGSVFPQGHSSPPKTMYRLRLAGHSLAENFFRIPEHRDRWMSFGDRSARESWAVVSVEATDRTEEVYCAVVPETEAFTLAGNILTGNCKDSLIENFYSEMFLNDLNYGEFLPNCLGREYFTVGEATSLAHFNESLGIWGSEEIIDPEMIRVSKSVFVQEERVQLLVKDMVDRLRTGPQGMPETEESPSERLERVHQYCCVPGTKVLTADLRWVNVESLEVGDPIMGFDEYPRTGKSHKREWVPTRVTATNVIVGNTYRISTSGPTVECTDQHRWLAIPQNRVSTIPIDTTRDEEFYPTYEWKGLPGREVKRSKPWVRRPCHSCGMPMELRPSAAAATKFCSKSCSGAAKNRSYSSGKNSGQLMWLRADEVRPGDKIMFLGQWDMDDSRDTGWMGGFLDGEGSLANCGITFGQNAGPVLDRALEILAANKFSFSSWETKPHANSGKVCISVRINGGWPEVLRALSIFRPVRLLQMLPEKIQGREITGDWVTVTEVTHVGEQDVIALATSSKTLIVEGMYSHNTELVKHYPEFVRAADQNDGLDISDALVSRLVNRLNPWDLRGTPQLMRSFRTLMMEESLNAAQDSVADRLYAPMILATLGMENLGDGEPWIPSQADLDQVRDDMQSALAADFKLMVHNMGLKVESVFGRESVPRFDQDYDRITAKLLQAWGIGEALIAGGSGGAYASSALNREVCEQLMLSFQKKVTRHIIKRMEVIAEAQEHYDYEQKGGYRRPLYREIVQYNEETGEEEIVRVPKLLIPEIKWSVLNLRDEATERAFVQQLKAAGVPVSDKMLAINLPVNFREELERSAEETVQKGLATSQAMDKLQKLCDAQKLPYPPELAQQLGATLQLRQALSQTEMLEGQTEMQEIQMKQMGAAGQMGLIPGVPAPPPPEPEDASGGAGAPPQSGVPASTPPQGAGPTAGPPMVGGPVVANPVELPRNRQRPEESDEMRAGTPRAAARIASIKMGPSSYGRSRYANEERVQKAVRRLEAIQKHKAAGRRVEDLVEDPEFYDALNAQQYEDQIRADFPEILNGKANQSKKILDDLLSQYAEIFGTSPEW